MKDAVQYRRKIAVDGSSRDVAGKKAACGWAVVQLDIDGSDIPWYGMYGTILVCVDMQRTIDKAVMWAFYMALVRSSGLACIYIDNFGVLGAQVRRQCVCHSQAY